MVVDCPAPFGPTKPVTWPGWTVNVIPSRATVGPNRLRRPLTSMVASMLATVGRPAGGSSRWGAVFAAAGTGDSGRGDPSCGGRQDARREGRIVAGQPGQWLRGSSGWLALRGGRMAATAGHRAACARGGRGAGRRGGRRLGSGPARELRRELQRGSAGRFRAALVVRHAPARPPVGLPDGGRACRLRRVCAVPDGARRADRHPATSSHVDDDATSRDHRLRPLMMHGREPAASR